MVMLKSCSNTMHVYYYYIYEIIDCVHMTSVFSVITTSVKLQKISVMLNVSDQFVSGNQVSISLTHGV